MHVMMALGEFRFALKTAAYQQLERSDEYRWESLERIGRAPAMQYIGRGHTTITLNGIIYPHFKSGLKQVDKMRKKCGGGEPHNLVSGYGKVFGKFVVMSISETQEYFFSNGAPRRIEFTMELKSYGGDGFGGVGRSALGLIGGFFGV